MHKDMLKINVHMVDGTHVKGFTNQGQVANILEGMSGIYENVPLHTVWSENEGMRFVFHSSQVKFIEVENLRGNDLLDTVERLAHVTDEVGTSLKVLSDLNLGSAIESLTKLGMVEEAKASKTK